MAKKKSAGEYNAFPYMCQLLCRTLWVFYGILSPDGLLIITVNSVGVFTQIIYVLTYLIYAPCDKKVKAFILVSIMNIVFPGVAIALSLLVLHGDARSTFVGVLCAVVTIGMYASPLSVMIAVIRTKSVESMPFLFSFFLLLNAGAWFAFAMFLQDPYLIVSILCTFPTFSLQTPDQLYRI
ncbi:bidirectional sugar transporter SWEET16-like [Lycium barbarum]|uniref:bidirectional sugar transporter SWEET16-like n=1 Tax=Lycium barbarum TaxID=112863 RepID=UPI00293F3113|nr:bidirectional sugar transporter SWEET16-like [Lycium barbarum]